MYPAFFYLFYMGHQQLMLRLSAYWLKSNN